MDTPHTLRSVLLLLLLGVTGAEDFKRWVPNTNFETAANWEGGNLPCANDHVRFPETLGSVFVQTNTTITELILPTTGELVLGNFVSLSFPLAPSYTPGCPTDREVKFVRTEPKSWFNPHDWCVTATEGADCKADQPNLLLTEQVPCRAETISFPPSSSFLVGLGSGADIYAGSLIIGGKSYSTSTFKTYVDSAEGRKQFVREAGTPVTTVTLTGNKCTDKSGCACGNDMGSILDKICSTPAGQCASVLSCTKTVKATGDCCDMCGAVMKLDIGSNFNKKDTENMILSKYVHGQDKYKDVKPIVSKTSLGQIQIVLTDGDDGTIAAEVAYSLKKDFEDNSRYDVSEVRVDVSETAKPTPSGHTGLETSGIVGIVFGIIIVAAIVALILFFVVGKRRRPTIPINLNFNNVKSTFKNFGRSRGPSDLELGTVSFKNTPGVEDLSYGFDNPMYGDAGQVKDMSSASPKTPVPATLEPAMDLGAGFSNPIYGASPIQLDFENLGESKSKKKDSKKEEKLTFPDATAAGFSNPMFGTPVQAVDSGDVPESRATPVTTVTTPVDTSDSAILVLNPVFSSDGVEQDSFI